jgi:hypothetical protein
VQPPLHDVPRPVSRRPEPPRGQHAVRDLPAGRRRAARPARDHAARSRRAAAGARPVPDDRVRDRARHHDRLQHERDAPDAGPGGAIDPGAPRLAPRLDRRGDRRDLRVDPRRLELRAGSAQPPGDGRGQARADVGPPRAHADLRRDATERRRAPRLRADGGRRRRRRRARAEPLALLRRRRRPARLRGDPVVHARGGALDERRGDAGVRRGARRGGPPGRSPAPAAHHRAGALASARSRGASGPGRRRTSTTTARSSPAA